MVQLRTALEDILALEGAKKPVRVRFFRVQMQTIITRALQELDIKPVQSRRCFSLIGTFHVERRSTSANNFHTPTVPGFGLRFQIHVLLSHLTPCVASTSDTIGHI